MDDLDLDAERSELVAKLCKDHPADCAFATQDSDGGGDIMGKGRPWKYVDDLKDLAMNGRRDEQQDEESEPTLPFHDGTEADESDKADSGNEWGRFKEQDRVEQKAAWIITPATATTSAPAAGAGAAGSSTHEGEGTSNPATDNQPRHPKGPAAV